MRSDPGVEHVKSQLQLLYTSYSGERPSWDYQHSLASASTASQIKT